MTCVVLGGSRHIIRLSEEVRARLDRIIEKRLPVVVGDANGADKALQEHFSSKGYRAVEVFCSGPAPRNNVGRWPCRSIATEAEPGTFSFYAAKDRAMAEQATVGFMLWDGKSAGTMVNVWRLLQQRKTSLVFVQAEKTFIEVRGPGEWKQLLSLASAAALADIQKKVRLERTSETNELPFTAELAAVQ
ncbi:MAG: hypothetical protein ABTQ32_06250 [Myxococcaceae bacterium]